MTILKNFGLDDEVSEISGDKVAELLKSELGSKIASALKECKFYRVDPDEPVIIKECDQHSGKLRVLDTKGVMRTFALDGGYLYLEPSIVKLLGECQAMDERNQEAQRQKIQDFGFTSYIRAEHISDISSAIRSAVSGNVPSLKMRHRFMGVMSGYKNPNAFAKVTGSWVNASGHKFLPDVLIKLLPALREAGRYAEAISQSDFLREPCPALTTEEKRILLTIRAAACLDCLESYLEEASRCVTESKRIAPSEHLDLVSARLEKLTP